MACVAAGAAAELAVRLLRPGFPGFAIPQVEHRPAPGVGFEMVPNQVAYTAGETVSINAHGLRGPDIRHPQGGANLTVLCLGDSITFGYGVGDDAPFPRQLERMLQNVFPERDVEVINAGVQRYSTYQEIDFLRLKGLAFRPDVVVLAVYANDIAVRPPGDYVQNYEKEREIAAGAIRNRVPALYTFTKNSALIELARGAYIGASVGTAPLRIFEGVVGRRDKERWDAMEQELARFAQLAREHDFVPLVITIPARIQLQRSFPDSHYPKRVLALAEGQGLATLDLMGTFRESLDRQIDPYLPWDNHLSPEGHGLVASVVGGHLSRLMPPPGASRSNN